MSKAGYIAIVGQPNAGKSTLLNHLVGQKISITSRKAQTTRIRITGILTRDETQFIFVDTPGYQTKHRSVLTRQMHRTLLQALTEVDVIVFVVIAGEFNQIDKEILSLLPETKPIVLAINKIDMLENKAALLPFIDGIKQLHPFTAIIPISAKYNDQLDALLGSIEEHLPQGPWMFEADDITDCNERVLCAELIREKIFRSLGEEVPYAAGVGIEEFKQEGALRRIRACIYVDKPGQKGIIIGKNGEKLKSIATQARLDMERLFDGKVFLEVWVKVKPGWADDKRLLNLMHGNNLQ